MQRRAAARVPVLGAGGGADDFGRRAAARRGRGRRELSDRHFRAECQRRRASEGEAGATEPGGAILAPQAAPSQESLSSSPLQVAAAAPLLLGQSKSIAGGPVLIETEEVKHHLAFLGGTGSGKTTAALALI